MLYSLAEKPGTTFQTMMTHRFSPGYRLNGWHQVGLKTSYMGSLSTPAIYRRDTLPPQDPNRGLSLHYGWQGVAERAWARRRGLSDAYINDNPSLRGLGQDPTIDQSSIDPSTTSTSDIPVPVVGSDQNLIAPDTTSPVNGPSENLPAPTADQTAASVAASGGVFSTISSDIGGAFATLFGQAVTSGTAAGVTAVQGAVAPTSTQRAVTAVKSVLPTTFLGISTTTLLLLGGVAGVIYFMRKK